MTSFYSWRLIFLTFHARGRATHAPTAPHERGARRDDHLEPPQPRTRMSRPWTIMPLGHHTPHESPMSC
jgi:NADH:ubiquinone oxidoreductase subunit 5 (subunit L)/multisubunit Na+/H+ antiporter MnhA subunit